MGDAANSETGETLTREPDFDDIARLCRDLNAADAKYVLVGGFAIILHGYPRFTSDVDLLIEVGEENEAKVLQCLSSLPDHAAAQVKPGEVDHYGVVRIGDEIMIDLMKSGCGITYADAIVDAVIKDVQGVPVPVASHKTMWRMKQTIREKDIPDKVFLRQWASQNNVTLDPPPEELKAANTPRWLDRLLGWIFGRKD
jgi:hypothetical protein